MIAIILLRKIKTKEQKGKTEQKKKIKSNFIGI